MERRRNEKRSSGRVQVERGGRGLVEQSGRSLVEEEEDYGDYVTRCICDFKHDDGYMICCDECSVWQHVDCMQVDPKNLPENYLCELCEPRPVDKRRAQKIQAKKREDISDAEERRKRKASGQSPLSLPSAVESKKPSSLLSSIHTSSGAKKRKRKGKLLVPESKGEGLRKSKREKPEPGGVTSGSGASVSKKPRRRVGSGKGGGSHVTSSSSSIQSLLTAASLLDEDSEPGGGVRTTPSRRKSDLWSADKSPWTDKYEPADENMCTEPVHSFLLSRMHQLQSEEVVYSHEEYVTMVTKPHPQCVLMEVGHKRQGVVVVGDTVPQDELVMECKGKIAMKQEVLADLNSGGGKASSSLWKHKPCPFVYLYDKIANVDLCIDSRSYGNLTRFIRRSCCPNAEVRHFFVSNELHFGVYALTYISPDEEVTLPFDFRYDKCDYVVECGCGQNRSACLVARGKYPSSSSTATPTAKSAGVTGSEEGYLSPGCTLQRSHSHVFVPQDEDSNSSWASTASSGRKRSRLASGHTPYKTQSSSQSVGPSRDGSSDSEEDTDKARKQSLSREERKTEQVWRVFEKMEASAQRKRQQLLSEGSHESDPLSSPSSLHPHPLSTRTLKDRRSSASSRGKVQLLPGGKMRLSSVSSTDPLSPFDPGEPFSPPLTPSLPPPTGSGVGAELRSPLPLLSPSSPVPHFQAAPQLHPKYLFADFALPWKKAILKQWESEQLNGHAPQPRSYWVSNSAFLDYQVTKEMMRPRTRGSLKHRWMKHYDQAVKERATSHDSHPGPAASTNDKENADLDRLRLSYKQRVLMRWQASGATQPSSSSISLPPSSPRSPAPTSSDPTPDPAPSDHQQQDSKPLAEGRGSPLFEEFSDSEEFMEQQSGQSDHTPSSTPPKQAPPTSRPIQASSPGTPPLEAFTSITPPTLGDPPIPVLTVRGASPVQEGMAGSHDQEEEPNLSGVSDISMESTSRGPATPITTGPQTPPTPEETTPPSNPAGVSDISSDTVSSAPSGDVSRTEHDSELKSMDTSTGNAVATPSGPVTEGEHDEHGANAERDSVPSGEGAFVEGVAGEESGRGLRPPPLDSLAPSSPLSATNTPSKTPGKRKITYTEYRSRARKPPEKKLTDKLSSVPTASTSSSPPPPSTPGTPSFLAHSFFTSPSLSGYSAALAPPTSHPIPLLPPAPPLLPHVPSLMSSTPSLLPSAPSLMPSAPSLLASTPQLLPLQTSALTTESAPYFEPVSPEDGDHTPKLISREGDSIPLGGGIGGVASSRTYTLPSYGGYVALQQQQVQQPVPGHAPGPTPLQGVPPLVGGGYVGEGGRWVAVDQGQDPRNRSTGVVTTSASSLIPIPGSTGAAPMSLMQAKPHPQPGLLGPLPQSLVAPQGQYPAQQGGYYTGPPPQQQPQQASVTGHHQIPAAPTYQPRHPPSGTGGTNYY